MADKTIRHKQDKLDCTPPGKQFMSRGKREDIAGRPAALERLSLEHLPANILSARPVSAFLSNYA